MDFSLKRILLYKVLPIFLLLLLILMGLQLINNYLEIRSLESEVQEKQQQIREAKEYQHKLEEELQKLDDPEYLEKLARQRLGLVKPGEELIIPFEEEEQD